MKVDDKKINLAKIQKKFPERYYAFFDPAADRPCRVIGWYDVWSGDYLAEDLPPAEKMMPLTAELWDWHFLPGNSQAQINADNTITSFVSPPLPGPTIQQQAQRELSTYQDAAALVTAMGQKFGPKTISYIKMLQNIVSGSDTEHSVLPDKPPNFAD